jgi:hypothetical protein
MSRDEQQNGRKVPMIPWEIMTHIMEYADVGTVRRMMCTCLFMNKIHRIRHAWLIGYIQREMGVLVPLVRELPLQNIKERVLSCLFMAYYLQWKKLEQPCYCLREWAFLVPILRFLYFVKKEIGLERKEHQALYYSFDDYHDRMIYGADYQEKYDNQQTESVNYIYFWTKKMNLPRAFFIVKKTF